MKPLSKNVAGIAGLCALLALLVAGATGCQAPGKTLSTVKSPACPMCSMETRTAPIKGMTYTKMVCPGCKTVRDTGTWAESADLTAVHVCDHCKAAVDTCPACASK